LVIFDQKINIFAKNWLKIAPRAKIFGKMALLCEKFEKKFKKFVKIG